MERITKENFSQLTSVGKVIVKFGADWCKPCGQISKVLEELDAIKVFTVNIEEECELVESHNIRNIPTLLFFNNGALIGRLTGMQDKATILKMFDND